MHKKVITVAVLLLVVVLVLASCTTVSKGTVANGKFEEMNGAVPEGWSLHYPKEDDNANATITFVNYENQPGSDEYRDTLGTRQVKLTVSSNASMAYIGQKVKLTSGKIYKLSGWMRVDSSLSGKYSDSNFVGAHIGFLEDRDFLTIHSKSRTSGWVYYETYFTSSTSKTMTLIAGIGQDTNAGKAKGTAYFGGITLEQVAKSAVPTDASVATLKSGKSYTLSDGASAAYMAIGIILTCVIGYGAYLLIRKSFAQKKGEGELKSSKWTSPLAMFIYILVGTFVVRLILVLTVHEGYGLELDSMSTAAKQLQQFKPWNFYENTVSTLPVGMLYILWILGEFANLTGVAFGSVGMNILLRLPMMIADIVMCYLIYNLCIKYYQPKVAALFTGVFALLPVFFTASGAWGMTMSICACLMVAAMIALINKNYIGTSVLYTVALMFDYYALILAPIVIAFMVYRFVKEKKDRVKIGVVNASAFMGFYLLSMPFTFNIFEEIYFFFRTMPLFNQDAINLYNIFALTNRSIPTAMVVLNVIFIAIVLAVAIYLYLAKSKNRLDLVLLSAFSLIFINIIGAKSTVHVMYLGIVLLFLYAIISAERRIYHIFMGYSLLSFINQAAILGRSGYLGNNVNADYIEFANPSAFLIVFSVLAIALTVYFAYVVYDICYRKNEYDILPLQDTVQNELRRVLRFNR